MKKFMTFLCSLAIVFGLVVGASATTYDFEDIIDDWNGNDFIQIREDVSLSYTHDINDSVDLAAGDSVIDAYLELDFTGDAIDSYGSWLVFQWDGREYAQVAYDGSDWINIGEQDNGQYELVLDIDWLNTDGELDVTISVFNALGTADAWLDHSRLYGTAQTATPTPEPTTMLLMGTGLIGLVGFSRKRINKKG